MEIPPTNPSVNNRPSGDSLVRGQRGNHYRPSEHAFDKAIERGDFRRAHNIINSLLSYERETIDELAANRVFTLALKEIALPMYHRAVIEQDGATYDDTEKDISSMYAHTTALMSFIKDEITKLDKEGAFRTEEGLTTLGLCKGALSEATVFALLSRSLKGTKDDAYTVLPASMREDWGGVNDGVRTGVDFKIIDRSTQSTIPIQVKTSRRSVELSRYQEGIVMLSLQQLARPHAIIELQDSLIAEVEGISTTKQDAILEHVSGKLNAKLERRFERINPSILGKTATRLAASGATSA